MIDQAHLVDVLVMACAVCAAGALAIWYFARNGERCPQCEHCREEKLQAERAAIERRKTEAHAMAHRRYGVQYCPYCTDEKENR